MKSFKNRVVAITGAASGIGRATAVLVAKLGAEVAICDVDETGLEDTAKQCRDAGARVSTQRIDVADRQAVYDWADYVVQQHGQVHVIVNNAGVALGATVSDMSYEDFEWLMGINFWGVVYGTKAFLPHLRRDGEGAIVNVSSVFGLIGVPTQSAYNAAKFAVKGFTESLGEELAIEGANISVTCVHPGGIKTNIARNARVTENPGLVDGKTTRDFEKTFVTEPDQAAASIVKAIVRSSRRLLIGPDAIAIDLMQRFLPTGYQGLLVAFVKRRRNKMLKKTAEAARARS
jgi:NAD(P)-dependent dehydrogenase (short-subunit alcohol dehydrogenase family)